MVSEPELLPSAMSELVVLLQSGSASVFLIHIVSHATGMSGV